jgi:hypothetical protein
MPAWFNEQKTVCPAGILNRFFHVTCSSSRFNPLFEEFYAYRSVRHLDSYLARRYDTNVSMIIIG